MIRDGLSSEPAAPSTQESHELGGSADYGMRDGTERRHPDENSESRKSSACGRRPSGDSRLVQPVGWRRGFWATVRPKNPGGTLIGRLASHAKRNRTQG